MVNGHKLLKSPNRCNHHVKIPTRLGHFHQIFWFCPQCLPCRGTWNVAYYLHTHTHTCARAWIENNPSPSAWCLVTNHGTGNHILNCNSNGTILYSSAASPRALIAFTYRVTKSLISFPWSVLKYNFFCCVMFP